jgi:hypothetical protein
MSPRKSYWQRMACRTERDKVALKSWFSPFGDDMTPESAEALCDIETDREKKLRVIMVDGDGVKHVLTRTFGKKTTTITSTVLFRPVAPPPESAAAQALAPQKALPPAHAEPGGST